MVTRSSYIYLYKEFFTKQRITLYESNDYRIEVFRYGSGVEAVSVYTKIWELIWLPFLGQQIWDFRVHNHSIKMHSPIQEPTLSNDFLDNYGGFLIHCGITGMGNPSPQDNHPLHGELPLAHYQQAFIEIYFSPENKTEKINLSGFFNFQKAFTAYYVANPKIYTDPQKSTLDIEMEVKNTSRQKKHYMYLAHANFIPHIGDRIVSTAKLTPDNVEVRDSLPEGVESEDKYFDFIKKVMQNPGLTSVLAKDHVYDPELVLWFKNAIDKGERAHALLIHSDDTAYWISYNAVTLDHAIRWIVMNPDMQAIGLILPATAFTEGYSKEKQKGNIKYLEPGQSVLFSYSLGLLEKHEWETMDQLSPSP